MALSGGAVGGRRLSAAAVDDSDGDDDGWSWVGSPLSMAECARRYPERFVADTRPEGYTQPSYDGPASQVKLGDSVALHAGEDSQFIMRVEELFEDVTGLKMFAGHYFYAPAETVMGAAVTNERGNVMEYKVQVPQLPQRLFLAADEDNAAYVTVHGLDTILRVVTVHRLRPGAPLPPRSCTDYWFDQIHSRKFFTFRDYYEEGDVPEFMHLPSGSELKVLELCSGAGGTSFLCQHATMHGKELDLRAKWAFDISQDANAAYQINDVECHTFVRGIDEGLMLSKIWETEVLATYGQQLQGTAAVGTRKAAASGDGSGDECWGGALSGTPNADSFLTASDGTGGNESDATGASHNTGATSGSECSDAAEHGNQDGQVDTQRVLRIFDVQLGDCAPRGMKGQSLGHLTADLQRSQCWLEYLAELEGGDGALQWVRDSELPPCDDAMRAFVAYERAEGLIPVRGQVDVIMGGPPCQGLSGLNRNAAQRNILHDAKNRLVKVYYEIVKWFQPKFTLMEQVTDCFKKEKALYVRFLASAITAMRYQCRIGVVAAGDYGCPQGRYRVLTWSARQGMPLPAFPEPSHRTADFRMAIPVMAQECMIGFTSLESLVSAHPMNVFGDVIGDLPEVSNFAFHDGSEYKSPPLRPWQVYVRRVPPEGTAPARQRAEHAAKLMQRSDIESMLNLLWVYCEKGPAALGRLFFCKGKGSHSDAASDFLSRLSEHADALPAPPSDYGRDDSSESDLSGNNGCDDGGRGEDEDSADMLSGSSSDGASSDAGKSSGKLQVGRRNVGAGAAILSVDLSISSVSSDRPSGGDTDASESDECELSASSEDIVDDADARQERQRTDEDFLESDCEQNGDEQLDFEEEGEDDGDGDGAAEEEEQDEEDGDDIVRRASDDEDGLGIDGKDEVNYAAQVWTAYLASIDDPAERERVQMQRTAQREAYAVALGETVFREIERATLALSEDAPLRDHRALQCNADDFERMAAVPSHKHACFRHMPGVVENEDGTCCAGHCHAWTNRRAGGAAGAGGALGGKGGCSAGGTVLAPERSLARISRIDNHDKNGWRGGMLPGCAANTHWLPSGDLLCPRWCITYQGGLSGRNGSRQSCFGRIWMDEVQPTVVTRAEPHNLRIVHPEEDRVLSIRENMRCQGFPDFWALVGLSAGIRVGTASIPARYMQVGNAVAPPMARMLGRCILEALTGPFQSFGTKEDSAVIRVVDPEMAEAYSEASRLGLRAVSEEDGRDSANLEARRIKWERELASKAAQLAKEEAELREAVRGALTAAERWEHAQAHRGGKSGMASLNALAVGGKAGRFADRHAPPAKKAKRALSVA